MNPRRFKLLTTVILGGISLALTARAANLSVQMVANGTGATNWVFSPTNIVIKTGDSITWTNTHSTVHDSTYGQRDSGTNGLWASTSLSATGTNKLFTFTFSNAGFYPYRCAQHADFRIMLYHPEQTGSVSVVSQPLLSQTVVSNGQYRMNITVGGAGQTYFVDASTNIANTNAWVPIATNIAPTNTFLFIDPANVTTFPQRYYRARQ